MNKVTANQCFVKLREMKKCGAKHRKLIETAISMSTHGFEISQDETMIMARFNCGTKVVVSPYHQIELIEGGQLVPVQTK